MSCQVDAWSDKRRSVYGRLGRRLWERSVLHRELVRQQGHKWLQVSSTRVCLYLGKVGPRREPQFKFRASSRCKAWNTASSSLSAWGEPSAVSAKCVWNTLVRWSLCPEGEVPSRTSGFCSWEVLVLAFFLFQKYHIAKIKHTAPPTQPVTIGTKSDFEGPASSSKATYEFSLLLL